MKDATFTIEFVSHCLASGRSRDPGDKVDRFDKDGSGKLIWKYSWWYSAIQQAIKIGSFKGIKPNDVNICLTVNAPIEVFKRRVVEGDNVWYKNHEAIMPGGQITFEAVVADHVTEQLLSEVLSRTGKFIGVSPYGHNLGFGRFEVVDVTVAPSV
ncbi:MAG: hypothetical protein V3T31_00290 [candidate division Zixibacteria bacterium]